MFASKQEKNAIESGSERTKNRRKSKEGLKWRKQKTKRLCHTFLVSNLFCSLFKKKRKLCWKPSRDQMLPLTSSVILMWVSSLLFAVSRCPFRKRERERGWQKERERERKKEN
jgi:hypothetical protein